MITHVFSRDQGIAKVLVNQLLRGQAGGPCDDLDAVFSKEAQGLSPHAPCNDNIHAQFVKPSGEHTRLVGWGEEEFLLFEALPYLKYEPYLRVQYNLSIIAKNRLKYKD